MPRRISIGSLVLLAVALPTAGLAFPTGFSPVSLAVLQEEDTEEDEACREAINNQVWAEVISICGPLVTGRDESHPAWEVYKQNVDYAYQTTCESAAQAADWDATLEACPAAVAALDYVPFHFYIGIAHQAQENAAEATAAFEAFLAGADAEPAAAAQLAQQVAMARRSSAMNLLMLEDREAAIPLLREVAASDPTDVEIHYQLGFALLPDEDYEGAEEAFSVVIAEDPDNPQLSRVFFYAGQIAYNAQEFDKAGERLDKYLVLDPEGQHAAEAHWMLAFVAGRNEDQGALASHYRAALAAAPDDPRAADATFTLGVIALNANQCNTAQRYFDQFRRIAPRGDARRAQVEEYILDIEDGLCEPGDFPFVG